MKKIFSLVIAFCCCVALFACGGKDNNTIEVAFIGNLSGGAKYYGEQVKMGAELALKEINAAGGVSVDFEGGKIKKQMKFIVKDDAGDATQAAQVYNQVKGKVCAVIGPVLSGAAESVANLCQKDGMPMITPSGSAESLTKGRDFVFRTCLTDPGQGTYIANFAEEQGYTTAVILKNSGSAYASGVCEYFVAQASNVGIEVVKTLEYTDENYLATLDQLAQQVVDANADVIVCPDYTKVNAAFAEAVHKLDENQVFVGADGWDSIVTAAEVDAKYLNNCYFTNNLFSGDKSENIVNFYKNFKTEYNTDDISAFAALAYDAVYVLAKAIEDAGSTDKAAIKNAIQKVNLVGITGNITFDANGNPQRDVPIIQIVDGEYVLKTKVTAGKEE